MGEIYKILVVIAMKILIAFPVTAKENSLREEGCFVVAMTGFWTLDTMADGNAISDMMSETEQEIAEFFGPLFESLDELKALTNPSANIISAMEWADEGLEPKRKYGWLRQREAIIQFVVSGEFDEAMVDALLEPGMRTCFASAETFRTDICRTRMERLAEKYIPECMIYYKRLE